MAELVSCILATRNRSAFVGQAIRCFQRQTYDHSELIVVDDGDEPVAELCSGLSRIRYLRLPQRTPMSEKLNTGVRNSGGTIIQKVDDDDYYAPDFLDRAVRALSSHDPARTVVAWCCFLVLLPGETRVRHSGHGWAAGGTLCFRPEVWQRGHFRDFPGAVDAHFLRDHQRTIIRVCAPESYLVVRHGRNTWTTVGAEQADDWFKRLPVYDKALEALVDPQDLPFYRSLPGEPQSRNELKSELSEVDSAGAEGKASNSGSISVSSSSAVSACLLSWKRPQNLEIIVRELRQVQWIDEILIWNNNPSVHLEFADGKTRVIQSDENQRCYGRFLCAAQARNPVVYVQDDDALNPDVAGLYRHFRDDPTRITHALTPIHWDRRQRRLYGEAHAALLGWGAFFCKEWLSVLEELPAGMREDWLFRREADRFFTMLLERKHNTVLADITHLEGHSTPGIALWCDLRYRHLAGLAVRQILRLLRVRRNPGLPVPWNIVIPCHNYGRYLGEAVESVFASDADYEIHIVDDASSDKTREVAADLARRYPHIHYLRNEEKRGPGYSRNRGIAALESSFVVLLDADDLIGPDYLFEAGRILTKGADVVNPDATLVGARRGCWVVPEVTTLRMLLQRNSIHCCSAFRRELWRQTGGIDEQMPCWEDYEFWIRLAAAGARIQGVHGDHFFYRQHESSRSDSAADTTPELRKYLRQKHASLYERTRSGWPVLSEEASAGERSLSRPPVTRGTPPGRPFETCARADAPSSLRLPSGRVSVVVVSYNEGDFLPRTIDSFVASLPSGGEVIVVDDGSTDGSAGGLADKYERVRVVRPSERLGVARARNFGAQHATGEVLVFSDAHVAVPPNWADPLLAVLARPEVGSVAPAISVMGSGRTRSTGYGMKWRDARLGVEWLSRQSPDPYPVPLLCGCFVAIRRNLFEETGGFDSGMVRWGAEDSELSIRLWTLGYECLVVPSVDVAHAFRGGFPYEVNWEVVLHNNLRLATIHFRPERLRRVVERLKQHAAFPAASARLAAGDVAVRSSTLRGMRRHDDDWFFSKFRSELKSELSVMDSAAAKTKASNSGSISVSGSSAVSACLLSWKRPQNLEIIVRELRQVQWIDEILIWNNNPSIHLEFSDSKTRVIQSHENQNCYGRFLCAAQARNPVVYVQDDDALNPDVAGLYRHFRDDPTRITHALTPIHWDRRQRRLYGEAHAALLGWGAFFCKEWLSVLEKLPAGMREDWLFRREADRFFTMLLERKHNTVPADITHLEGHSTPGIALWCDLRYRHLAGLAVRQILRLLRVRRNPGLPVPWNIVIPCHNYGRYLGEAVESVFASDADYEIHIVDDASSDKTREVAADLARRYPHVHYLRNEERRGPGYSRNRGIAALESSFVVLLDADDLIGPDYLFEADRILTKGADVANPDATLFGALQDRWVVPEVTTLKMLLQRNSVHCSSAFRRELWSKTGGIDEQIPYWMDYEFWIRLAAAGARIQRVHGDHFFYRQHENSLTNSANAIEPELRKYLGQKHASLFESFGLPAGQQ